MIESEFVQVAVEAPLQQTLTYRLPKALASSARLGSRVKVPLGKRHSKGVLIGPSAEQIESKLASIKDVQDVTTDPAIGEKTLKWLKWVAQYYIHPPGQVYSMAFAPGGEVRKRKSNKSSPTGFGASAIEAAPPTPNDFQQNAIDKITADVENSRFETFLLYGVTGSGKTEVYLRSIESVLKTGKQALVLVPEISLTPQLIKRFVGRFGEKVAVIHSHLTDRERADQWWSAVKKEKQILIGARSALFCPLEELGLIIVDEEHEPSFKQEEQLKYNARDAAVVRAQFASCPVVLGSATPSLESWQNAKLGKYKLLELPSRVENRPLPEVEVVDMRLVKKDKDPLSGLPFWLSPKLHEELCAALQAKQQSALFLNRRGFAQFVICPSCGYVEQCSHCSVTLTVHRRGAQLECHYCGLTKKMPEQCPSCKQDQYKPLGLGTEKVAEDLQVLFPEARVARADRDEINSRESLESLIDRINKHEIDIVVGTQMIAKGHDFPNLTLVGAVLADVGLHLPDFRSSERTFQLLMQVAGRAGRHQHAGRVVIQTYVPEHPAISFATQHAFGKFADHELQVRQELQYPPFGKLTQVRLQGTMLPRVEQAADDTRARILKIQNQHAEYKGIEVLGPCEAPLAKVRGKHRYQLLLKAPSTKTMNLFLQHLTRDLEWLPPGVKLTVDVDPLQLL